MHVFLLTNKHKDTIYGNVPFHVKGGHGLGLGHEIFII